MDELRKLAIELAQQLRDSKIAHANDGMSWRDLPDYEKECEQEFQDTVTKIEELCYQDNGMDPEVQDFLDGHP